MDWLRKTETKMFSFFLINIFTVLQSEESCHFKHSERAPQFLQYGSNNTHEMKEKSTILSSTSPSRMSKKEPIPILTWMATQGTEKMPLSQVHSSWLISVIKFLLTWRWSPPGHGFSAICVWGRFFKVSQILENSHKKNHVFRYLDFKHSETVDKSGRHKTKVKTRLNWKLQVITIT